VTWTKLGDEFSDETRDLTDAEHRTHVDALIWSNRRGLDLHIPKRDLQRFAESPAAGEAVTGLAVKGWWEDRGDSWYVGVRFPEWQLERDVIEKRREGSALRMRRSRMHRAGIHSICLPERCADVTRNETRNETRDPGRVGSGTTYPPDPLIQDQDQNQDPAAWVGARSVTTPARRGRTSTRSDANSENRRVHDGPDNGHLPPTPADETTPVGEQPQTVTRASGRFRADASPAETWARGAECPVCGAGPGEPCHRPDGKPVPLTHRRRFRAARLAGTAP